MFTTDVITGLSYFRPGSLQPLYMFELFGLLVALALYNGITLPISFPLAFYKNLLGFPCDELRDIQDGWPEIARSLQSRMTLFVSSLNANCRAVSFPSPAFAPVIKTLSVIRFSFNYRTTWLYICEEGRVKEFLTK